MSPKKAKPKKLLRLKVRSPLPAQEAKPKKKGVNHYGRGARFENLAKHRLIRRGYSVTRSAGSKGAADLIASNTEEVLYIQVGTSSKNIREAFEKLATIKCPPCGKKQVWIFTDLGEWEEHHEGIPF